MVTRLTPVATLIDTKEQSGTTGFSTQILTFSWHLRSRRDAGGGSSGGAIDPPKTYESNFYHHDFIKFGKQHSRYEAILPSIVLSQ